MSLTAATVATATLYRHYRQTRFRDVNVLSITRLRGTEIPAGPITHYHFPTYTRCSENHNNTCVENRKSAV